MRNIMISVDIDRNEILTESIRTAIHGEVRHITRTAFEQMFREEIDRIVEARCEEYFAGGNGEHFCNTKLKNMLIRAVDEHVQHALKTMDLTPKTMYVEVSKRLDKVDDYANERLTSIDNKIEHIITKKVEEMFSGTLATAIANAIINRCKTDGT